MRLFFDSGATKCDCILLDTDGHYIHHFTDEGINATYMREDEIHKILSRIQGQTGTKEIEGITFSGAGCGNEENATRIRTVLERLYPAVTTEVISDLLGACRILSTGEKGIVAILGTGASACLYDGKTIVRQAPSLGYMLGDEGSGTYLGKLLIQKYLRNEMPDDIEAEFRKHIGIDKQDVIRRIYREAAPNRFLASFAQYIGHNKQIPFYRELLSDAFNDFFRTQIEPIHLYNINILHIIGSVGYHFKDNISEVAIKNGITIGKIAQSPLQFLCN